MLAGARESLRLTNLMSLPEYSLFFLESHEEWKVKILLSDKCHVGYS